MLKDMDRDVELEVSFTGALSRHEPSAHCRQKLGLWACPSHP